MATVPTAAEDEAASATRSRLLTLPLEIRLQIYNDVLLSHPIFHAHLVPAAKSSSLSNVQEFHTTIERSLDGLSSTTSTLMYKTMIAPNRHQPVSTLYPFTDPTIGHTGYQYRGKIPTGLLASCKQIYDESHTLPWQTNTFSFINWFWSGVYTALRFTGGLRPWQIDALRWVSLEVLTRDLTGYPRRRDLSDGDQGEHKRESTEWTELCRLWKGAWGLRLRIKGSLKNRGWMRPQGKEEAVILRPEELSMGTVEGRKESGILDVEKEWVQDGLLLLTNIRWIELEFGEGEDGSREEKLRFCRELGDTLNSRTSEGSFPEAKVVLVERKVL